MSRADALVERFIEVQNWPTSRRVALICVLEAGVSAVVGVAGHLLFARSEFVEIAYFDVVLAACVAHGTVLGVVVWRLAERGVEAGWSFYALTVPFLALLFAFEWGHGPLTSGFLVVLPLSLAVGTVFFNDRQARLSVVLYLSTATALLVLPATEWLPYAPAIDTNALSDLSSTSFALTSGLLTLFVIAVMSTLVLFLVAAGNSLRRRLDEAQQLIARYVPSEVAEDILQGRLTEGDAHHRRKLTVFFSDLVGFSDVAEELEPEDLARVLNDYFGEMTAIAYRHHGTVDELQGDALLILFGAPRATSDQEHALNAVRMASEMHEAMALLNERWARAGITETLEVRMGINTGVVTVGSFGTATRMKYAALGKHVNIAARLQAIAEPGTTVISYATYLLIRDHIPCQSLGPQSLKGIAKPVEAFVVLPAEMA